MKRKRRRKSTKGLKILIFLAILLSLLAYSLLFINNIRKVENPYFIIESDDTKEDVLTKLAENNFLKIPQTFTLVTKNIGSFATFRPGKYLLSGKLNNYQILQKFRNGGWETITIKIKPEMSRKDLITYFGEELEANGTEISQLMKGNWTTERGLNYQNVWCIFLVDYYYFNYATKSDQVLNRFFQEYEKFWTKSRREKAKKIGLTIEEVTTLATIVDGEAVHDKEMNRIAGLYMNRIEKKMPLQADPTILFLIGEEGRKRVLKKDLIIPHPYNTYLKIGLPPGPIRLPRKAAIDAVLNFEIHNFIYMCARPDNSLLHTFTESYAEHQKNAALYHQYLNRLNIRQ